MPLHPTGNQEWDRDADQPLPLPPALLYELRQALQAIRYGTIELVIHNGTGGSARAPRESPF